MTAKKRQCFLCGENLTSKQYDKVMYRKMVRIVCPGKCSAKLSAMFIKDERGIRND